MRRRLRRVLRPNTRSPARLRSHAGFGLVELLIALTVTSVAIMALVAALSSGYAASLRASRVATAAAVAIAELESFRALRYAEIVVQTTSANRQGADSRLYPVTTTVVETCPNGSAPSAGACSGGGRPLRSVTVEVREPTTNAVLTRHSSAFEQLTTS